jgi:hypothetical protein
MHKVHELREGTVRVAVCVAKEMLSPIPREKCRATNGGHIEIHRAHKNLGTMLENVSTSRVRLVIKVTCFIILTFSDEHALISAMQLNVNTVLPSYILKNRVEAAAESNPKNIVSQEMSIILHISTQKCEWAAL